LLFISFIVISGCISGESTMAQLTASRLTESDNAAPPLALDMVQPLKVTGHLMSLPAGLFCIVNEPGPGKNGLPGIRISPPPNGNADIEIAGFRPDGWLATNGDAALVRISRGPAQILVTIYQSPNQADAPKLLGRKLRGGADAGPAATPVQGTPQAATPAQSTKMDVMAHIQSRGDVGARFGDWLGAPGGGNWIEGFAIAAPEGIEPRDFSYQAVLGRGWLSPWVEAGQYCGSRGMALPLLGLRLRLQREAAEQFELGCSATFTDGSAAGPMRSDETCEGIKLAPLEAMQVTLTPRLNVAPKPGRPKR
jgi:hypothetical protein